MSTPPPPIPPETRDWTFVIERGCQDCDYSPHDPVTTKSRLTAANGRWRNALLQPGVHDRPSPDVWSPIEYACHARDMVRLLGERVAAMLDDEDPTFADWDGDAAAVQRSYWAADPRGVAADLTACTQRTLNVLARIAPADLDAWGRTGHRSDGVAFTVTTLCQYLVHDVEHHLHDVHG